MVISISKIVPSVVKNILTRTDTRNDPTEQVHDDQTTAAQVKALMAEATRMYEDLNQIELGRCAHCGAPYEQTVQNKKFCSTLCRGRAKNARDKLNKTEQQEHKEELVEQTREPDTKSGVRDETPVVAADLPNTAETTQTAMYGEAACSYPDAFALPWLDTEIDFQVMRTMHTICHRCVMLSECALIAQQEQHSGTWGGATLSNGRALAWLCPDCGTQNEQWEVCRCGTVSMAYKARATIEVSRGNSLTPSRKPYALWR